MYLFYFANMSGFNLDAMRSSMFYRVVNNKITSFMGKKNCRTQTDTNTNTQWQRTSMG